MDNLRRKLRHFRINWKFYGFRWTLANEIKPAGYHLRSNPTKKQAVEEHAFVQPVDETPMRFRDGGGR